MLNYGTKKYKIYGDKLIKKCIDKDNNQIWYCKHCHKHHVFKTKGIMLVRLNLLKIGNLEI